MAKVVFDQTKFLFSSFLLIKWLPLLLVALVDSSKRQSLHDLVRTLWILCALSA